MDPTRSRAWPRIEEAARLCGEDWSWERPPKRSDCDDETVRHSLKRAPSDRGLEQVAQRSGQVGMLVLDQADGQPEDAGEVVRAAVLSRP